MNTSSRIFWLFALTMFTAGCSGFHSACYTWTDDPGVVEGTPWENCDLRAGEMIRITTLDGSRVVGRIDRVTPEWLVIHPEFVSSSPRLYSPSQILSIEKSTATPAEPAEKNRPEIGDKVCMCLKDGSRVEGEVLVINDQEIVLNHKGQSSQPRGYPVDQVEWLETSGGSGASWVGPVVGFVIAGLVIGGIMVANSLQGLDNMWGN